MTMSKTFAMFPGQGSQYVGMAKILLDEFPYTKKIYEEAEDAAKIQIKKLCLDGPESELKLTANTQPCIVATSVATFKVMQAEKGFTADLFAGHSLGEYSALVAAGRLKFADAIFLVRRRGEAMQKAVPEGKGAMAAVLNVDHLQLDSWCKKVSTKESSVEIVNFNSAAQLVVAGATTAVRKLEELLSTESIKYVDLPVSAPFHSSMMKPARIEMTSIIEAVQLVHNKTKVIPNLTADITEEYKSNFLVEQIDSPVKWMQTVEVASQYGANHYVEVGPGKVLWGLARRILPKGENKLAHTDQLKDWIDQN